MSTPITLGWKLTLPVIAAPMFLVSGPQLVIAAMRAGIVGTFPALNQRTTEGYTAWIDEIRAATADLAPESWRTYNTPRGNHNPTNDHYDHVHVSFKA